MDVSRKVASSI